MISREAAYTDSIVFGLSSPGIEPTTYCTLGEHANYYTTDAVQDYLEKQTFLKSMKNLFK